MWAWAACWRSTLKTPAGPGTGPQTEVFEGEAVHQLVFPRPVFSDEDRAAQQARLTQTQWAQPAIGVASVSMLALLRSLGLKPAMVGGHSFGEVTALHRPAC